MTRFYLGDLLLSIRESFSKLQELRYGNHFPLSFNILAIGLRMLPPVG
jgi:hypothetical protein